MPNNVADDFLESVRGRFRMVRDLGARAMAQIGDEDFLWRPDDDANSIAIIVQHLNGNMLSRWTGFLTTDGEKPTRDRDGEFEARPRTGAECLRLWEEGWVCLFAAIDSLSPRDLERPVSIRGELLTAIDAIHRQLAHVAYHVGQIVALARMRKGPAWQSLSIPRGKSRAYRPQAREALGGRAE